MPPVKEAIERQQLYLIPSIEFSKPMKHQKRPVRMGIGMSANISVKDSLKEVSRETNLSNKTVI